MVSIGDRIEVLLAEKKISKKELIETLGLSRSGLHHKMKTNAFKAGDIKLLSTFFDVNEDYFLSEDFENGKLLTASAPESSRMQNIIDKFLDELNQLRHQLQKKDEQIDKLIDLLGKPNVSTEIPPVGQGAVVLPLFPLANSCANTRNLMIA